MKKKISVILLLTMILTGSLGMGIITRPSMAQDGKDSVLNRDFVGKTGENSFPNNPAKPETSESPSQSSQSEYDRWNFNDTSQWSNYTYADGNKTRLIVGVDGARARASPNWRE
jgi:hypothetical protein